MPHYQSFSRLPTVTPTAATPQPIAFLRVDFNLPFGPDQTPLSYARIDASRPTVHRLLHCGYRVILLTHFGQPTPEEKTDPQHSVAQLLPYIAARYNLELPPTLLPYDLTAAADMIRQSQSSLYLLENTRFYPGETTNDLAFTQQIAALADPASASIYLNDAFSVSHRKHSTICRLPSLFPGRRYYGAALEEEIAALSRYLAPFRAAPSASAAANSAPSAAATTTGAPLPSRGTVAIIGGKKISTKLPLLQSISQQVEHLILGGAIANTFAVAAGHDVGISLYEPEMLATARHIMANSRAAIFLPVDYIVSEPTATPSSSLPGPAFHCLADQPFRGAIGDIGPQTIARIEQILASANVVMWCGPLGRYEIEQFAAGSSTIATSIARRTAAGQLDSVAGGGDTIAALQSLAPGFSYCSNAGGAFMAWLCGEDLPGLTPL